MSRRANCGDQTRRKTSLPDSYPVIQIKRLVHDPRQGLFVFGDQLGAILLGAKIAHIGKIIKSSGHPVAGRVLCGCEIAQAQCRPS